MPHSISRILQNVCVCANIHYFRDFGKRAREIGDFLVVATATSKQPLPLLHSANVIYDLQFSSKLLFARLTVIR